MGDFSRVVLKCECIPCHDWMAFASWYSFRKFIPDVSFCVSVRIKSPIFRWVTRLSSICRRINPEDIVLSPTVIAVREFDGDWTVSPSKSQDQTCLVDYSGGCGNFVVDDWINKNQCPFGRVVKRFGNGSMTVNEAAVLKSWEMCEKFYLSMGV